MREIIQLHIGQPGLQLANATWELFALEHGIQLDGQLNQSTPNSSNLQVFWSEAISKSFTPRAAFFDYDDVSINTVKKGPLKKLIHPSYINHLKNESGSIWPRAYKSDDNTIEILRKLLEGCDAISGIILYHSMSGGYGGGFTCKLLEELETQTVKTTKATVTIMPSDQKDSVLDQSIVEPYNSILSLGKITQKTDFNIMFENSAIYKVCDKQLGLTYPNYYNLNSMIAQAISSITQSIRLKGSKLADFLDIRQNLILTPKQQFLWCSYSPFIKLEQQNTLKPTLQQMTEQLFDQSGAFLNINPLTQKFIGSSLFFKGDCPLNELKSALKAIKVSDRIRFAEGLEPAYQTAICQEFPTIFPNQLFGKTNRSVCMLANSTAVLKPFQQIKKRFKSIYSKKQFLHWYVGAGMEEGELPECAEALDQIIELYNGTHGKDDPLPELTKEQTAPKESGRTQQQSDTKVQKAPQVSQQPKTQQIKKQEDKKQESIPQSQKNNQPIANNRAQDRVNAQPEQQQDGFRAQPQSNGLRSQQVNQSDGVRAQPQSNALRAQQPQSDGIRAQPQQNDQQDDLGVEQAGDEEQ